MEGFDTLTMSYLAGGSGPDALSVPMVPLDPLDHRSTYNADAFARSDSAYAPHHIPPPPPPPPPPPRRFSAAYDDPFSDVLSGYAPSLLSDLNGQPESASIEREHKLLSFSLPNLPFPLLNYAMQRATLSLSAQLHGMFFLAESPWTAGGDGAATPTELTCYRRNLFQITGTVTLSRSLQFLMTEQGDRIPILGQELTIAATESLEGNSIKIISVPWKTTASSAAAVEDKTEKEPPSYPLDLSASQDTDSEYVNFPISWKRLQFRIATANNGRRRELQQHFVVRLKVVATLATGDKIPICEVHSGAIIVRGRSPRNFQSRKDMPIGGGGGGAVRKALAPHQPARTPGGENGTSRTLAQSQPVAAKPLDSLPPPFDYDPNDPLLSPDFSLDWKLPSGAMPAMPPDPTCAHLAAATPYEASASEMSRNQAPQRSGMAPVSLSLTDDEPKKLALPPDLARKRTTPARPPSFSVGLINCPDESADLLYEYFPLGLDDWMPPVDAVYRPHVVHHTNLPQDPKALAVRNKSKRYFSDAW